MPARLASAHARLAAHTTASQPEALNERRAAIKPLLSRPPAVCLRRIVLRSASARPGSTTPPLGSLVAAPVATAAPEQTPQREASMETPRSAAVPSTAAGDF